MNGKWIISLVTAVAAGVVAYGVTRTAIGGRCAPSVARLEDVSFLARELRLTDVQARQIRSLHVSLGLELNDCCMRHCAARARLAEALAADTNGTQHADAVVAEMCKAYEEGERATLNRIRQVRVILNGEQRKRFDGMISECMCGKCSVSGSKMTQ